MLKFKVHLLQTLTLKDQVRSTNTLSNISEKKRKKKNLFNNIVETNFFLQKNIAIKSTPKTY